MIRANIHTAVRVINVPCTNDRKQAISALQAAVSQLTPEDGRCRFVVSDSDHDKEIYSWEYQPTFREDLKEERTNPEEEKGKESNYEWSLVYYILKNGKEFDYDNLYKNEWDLAAEFDEEKTAHNFMKGKGYGRHEYRIVYEYEVHPKNEDWICGTGMGLTRKEARETLNKNLEYYHLKLLANGKVKEL